MVLLADSLAHFIIRDLFSGLRFFLHSEVLLLLFIIIASYVIILAFGFSLINLSSIPKFRSAILLIVLTLTVSLYNYSHGLAYLPSLRWSFNILLVTIHKLPNIISKHCLVGSSRISDGSKRELWTLSFDISMFSKNITLPNINLLASTGKSKNNEEIFW